MAGGNVQRKNIDWNKSDLRLVYLIEGQFRGSGGGLPHYVRWCGPRGRTGSGFLAYATMGPSSFPFSTGSNVVPHVPSAWESRLSGAVFDSTMGTLKQHVQALSQVSVQVDLGYDDDTDVGLTLADLRDSVTEGRWFGQPARLILVDADEIERFEIVVEGTWDRDPTKVTGTGFSMVIDAGEIIPPTLLWGAQIPDTVDYFQTFSYLATKWSPDGSSSGKHYSLNENHKGKWIGEIFGGGTQTDGPYASDPPIGGQPTWREVVPYGATSSHDFAWVSPRFDQMLYDLVMETEDGLKKMSNESHPNHMLVFNNDDPRRGPVGTCVTFDHVSGFDWAEDGHRIFGRVAGGEILLRPAGYSNIGYSGNPKIADNTSLHGICYPDNSVANPGNKSNAVNVFAQIIQDPHFLDAPDWLHPNALSQLMASATIWSFPVDYRNAVIPRDLKDTPLKYREVLESLMRSIPADLVLRLDPADGRRKYFGMARQQPGQVASYQIQIGDLADSSTPARVTMIDNPDGYYANEMSFSTSEYYNPPITGMSEESANKLVRKNHWQANLIDVFEQSSAATGQVVPGEETLKWWRHEDADAFRQWAVILEVPRSQRQRVITAVHGWRSMRFDLGRILEYRIEGVYRGPGQIRGMRFNLDSQTVTVKSYHLPVEPVRIDPKTTVRDKARAVSHEDTPHIDRRRD